MLGATLRTYPKHSTVPSDFPKTTALKQMKASSAEMTLSERNNSWYK